MSADTFAGYSARIPGRPAMDAPDRLVIVTEPDGTTVAVRWRMAPPAWDCKACGRLRIAGCPHTYTAALLLAQRLLGLIPGHPIHTTPANRPSTTTEGTPA